MRLYLATFGSRGDNEPFAALATAAAQQGHEVVFAHTSDFERRKDSAYEHWDLPGSLSDLVADQGVSLWKALRHYRSVWKPALEAVYEASTEQIRQMRPDVVVYHPKVLTAPVIAHEVGALAVAAELAPILTPTREFPAAGIPWDLPASLNRASFHLVELGLAAFGSRAKRLAQELGVRSHEPDFTLCPVSPTLVAQPADWPNNAVVTGQWNDPGQMNSARDDELSAFVAPGNVLYAGFGSMRNGDAHSRAEVIVDSARRRGLRTLLVTGWGGLDPSEELRHAPDVLVREAVDHASVLDSIRVALHHGGAGTTHAMLRAGVPSVIMPFLGDQPWWANRLHAKGLGPAAIHRNTRSTDRLAQAIGAAMGCQEQVEEVTQQIRGEDGCAEALEILTSALARG